MARQARVEYPRALYHAITRGNQRQKIFKDDRDRTKYLELLSRLKELHSFRIHAYVLMPNHVHLLVESGQVPLSRIMQRLGSGYTQYFNRRHGLWAIYFRGATRLFCATKIVIYWSSADICT
jgi:REP element-mobilizing transposase RayT